MSDEMCTISDAMQKELKYGLPEPLAKACHDPYKYEVTLSTGKTYNFEQARYHAESGYIELMGIDYVDDEAVSKYCYYRGVFVNPKHIVTTRDCGT